MSTARLSDLPPLARKSSCPDAGQVSLVVRLTAAPSARLTQEIAVILRTSFDRPYTFLGSVGQSLTLDLRLSDPGLVATESLARRLLKLKGVKKLKAERVCARRGAIYAISLKSPTDNG